MKKILATSLLCSSLLFAANSDYNYEITPMIGAVKSEGNLNLENQKVFGLSLGRTLSEDAIFDQLEFGILGSSSTDYESSNQDTKVIRFFSNLIKEYGISEKTSLYALVGLGYEKFSEERFGNEDDGFGNYGFGLKYKLSQNVSLKTDLRHLITFDGDNHLLYTIGLGIAFGPKAKPMPMKKEMPMDEPAPMKQEMKEEMKQPVKAVILDDDNDGVKNSLDDCPNSKPAAVVDVHGCDNVIDLNLQFDTDSAKVKNQYNSNLSDFALYLKKRPKLNATIEAHTDSVGSKKYNQKLSEKRAASTIKALKELNVDTNRLKAVGYGETKPAVSNKTKEGRTTNRRVEAVIQN